MGHHQGPRNTLAMMMGKGPYGNIQMGGMFTTVKVRDDIKPGEYGDPEWYNASKGTVVSRVSSDPDFGNPIRRKLA